MSLTNFQKLLAETTGIKPWSQEVLVGFPPKPVKVTTCCYCGMKIRMSCSFETWVMAAAIVVSEGICGVNVCKS